MGKLFGTDGIRGVANETLTCQLAYRVGQAAAISLGSFDGKRPKVVIGKDTRISSDMLEAALLAGCGMDAPIETLLKALTVENVIITGVHRGEEIGYCARLNGQYMEIFKPCLPQTLHGTGDVFVSALCGELMNGKGMPQALKDAAEFCDDCVQKTAKRGESHWYGLAFEDKLKEGRGL